jgi:dopamine beta-monooxygenase
MTVGPGTLQVWSESLCRMDSDGDGKTNGQELGDPNCLWTEETIPDYVTGITHPGNLITYIKYQ